ncbi:SpoIIE family protein phosphatase [Streptomyces venetus]|uniref:SpoIIE family protein phosphatase n=1 Tax=Streptomyces venetus TaxID=1701086 RepID=UPI003C2AFD1C
MSTTDLPGEADQEGEPQPRVSGAELSPAAPAGGDDIPAARTPGRPPTSPVGRLAATVDRLRHEVQAAQAAADGRALIDLAKGVLVERLHCGPAEAARQLAELADQSATTPLELAADIINQAARDRLTDVAVDFVTAVHGTSPTTAQAASAAVRLRTAESGALAAGDTQAVADSLLEHALKPLGATGVAIWAAGADGSLTLAGSSGFPAGEAERWRYVPPGVATVARTALTERRPEWIESLAVEGPPSIGRTHHPDGGRVAVPTGVGGRIHGVLEICWPGPLTDQPPAVARQLEALAELCAHTLEIHSSSAVSSLDSPTVTNALSELVDLADALYDPALVLLPQVDDSGHLTDFRIHHANHRFRDPAGRSRSAVNGTLLLEAYPMAADESGLFHHVERVYATGEPFRAGRMTLTALVDQVPLSSVAEVSITRHGNSVLLIWRIEDEVARLANLLEHAQRLGRIGGFEENFVTGEITWNSQMFALYGREETAGPVPVEELRAHAHADDAVTIGRFLRTVLHHRKPASAAFRLQRPDGVTRHMRVVAEPVVDVDESLLAVRGAYQDVSAQHWTEVALAATRDQLAYSEQQAVERNRLTLQLQQAIMPVTAAPLDAPGLRTAVRYRPAETDHLVGGDWYDAVVLPSKHILLSVGDVAGHGIEAATSMVVLRNALRGLAVTGAGPAQLLSWLNNVAHHLSDSVTATAVCALYDPSSRVLRWARAGHLPPVLVRGGQATTMPLLKGLLLGAVSDVTYEEADMQLELGDTLLMYTDGLVERRDRSMEESLNHLLVTASATKTTLDQRLDHLLTYSKSDTDDDTCVISIEVM